MHIKDKFLIGYRKASEFTGLPVRRLQRMVEARQIRAIKPNLQTIMFVLERLMEDILAMEVAKI